MIFLNCIGVRKSLNFHSHLNDCSLIHEKKRITKKSALSEDYKGRSSTWDPFFNRIHEKYSFAESN